ncbi:MAG: hypothetical protein JXA69_12975, partial [Phycisphaerae bacterium]|nr:hypothetical protein [Phycisphaerae bacterium]
MSTQTLERALKVQTDTKRMRAFIRPLPDEDYSGVTEGDLTKALGAESIAITDAVKQRMAAFLALCQSGSLPAEEFTLA